MILLAALVVILAIVTVVKWNGGKSHQVSAEDDQDVYPEAKPDIDVELLTVNDYSRPGLQVDEINGIVVHYTANPGSTAMENRDYFEGLKDSQITQASSNFVIGLEGEIVQCVPTWEVAYASNERNDDTISIECCHPDETGEFEDATYNSLVDLCTWLCLKYDLTADDIIRHYDVTGKICPKYFVENEDAWEVFLEDVREKLTEYR
jgi:N-acetylmuramoyl-L-alanine amidase CwlA